LPITTVDLVNLILAPCNRH